MESILEIALMMPAGSRMIIKVLGASQLMLNTFSPLMSSYTRWAAYKMPTGSEASREWYLLLDRKRKRKQPIVTSRLLNFWHGVRNEIFEASCRATLSLQRSKAYMPKPVYRLDWFSPGLQGSIRSQPRTTSGGRPLPSTYKYDFGDSLERKFSFDWDGRIEEKFETNKRYVAGRRIRWREDYRDWQQLFPFFDT